jgi:hypothetical protein
MLSVKTEAGTNSERTVEVIKDKKRSAAALMVVG